MPGRSGVTVVTMLVCLFLSHTRLRVHWAPGFPCALCLSRRQRFLQKLGRITPRERGVVSEVGAMSLRGATRPPELNERPRPPKLAERRRKVEATKQSILPLRGAMDCFAEPVIGRAFARPVARNDVESELAV